MLRKWILLSLFVFAACATTQPYEPPRTTSPAQFTAYGVVERDDVQAIDWWTRFDDPVLNDLVARALAANSDIRESLKRVEAVRAIHAAVRQEFLPRGGAVVSQTREQLPGAGGDRHRETNAAGLEAGWELDLFGRIRSASRAAGARADAAEAFADEMRIVVAGEVARTYFELRAAEARVALRESYRKDQQELVAIVSARVEEGFSSEADLARAETTLAEDDAALAAEQHTVRRLQHALAVLVGEMPGAWSAPRGGELRAATIAPIEIGDPAALLRRRPDVRLAERELAAQTAEIGIATAALFPRVELGGFLGFIAGGFGDLGDGGTSAWSLTPSIRWGLFDLGRTRAEIRRSRAEAEAALIAYERAVLRALEDAERSFSALAAAQQIVGATDAQLRSARRASELVEAQYDEGAAGYFELLDARRSAVRAEIARIDAVSSHRVAAANVFRAIAVPVAN